MHGMIGMGQKQKPGPKPKEGERYPSGKLKPAKKTRSAPPEGFSPTHIRRALDNAWILASSPMLRSQVGLMLMRKELTPREASAAFIYGSRIGRLERLLNGAPRRTTKSQAFEFGFSGGDQGEDAIAEDTYEAWTLREEIKRNAEEVRACVPEFPIIASTIIEEVCCNDRPVNALHIPGLKVILRKIADKLGLPHEGAEPGEQKRHQREKGDEGLYGMAAVDALEAEFARIKADVDEFGVLALNGGSTIRLMVIGHDRETGEVLGRKADVEVRGMLGATLVDRLIRFAESKGWKRRGQ